MYSSILQNREILPIENYKIQYYVDGEIVALWSVVNIESPIRIKGNYTKKDIKTKPDIGFKQVLKGIVILK